MDSEDDKISCQICTDKFSNILSHLKKSPSCSNAYSPIAKQRLIELCDAKKKKEKKLRNAAAYKARKEQNLQVSQLYFDYKNNSLISLLLKFIAKLPTSI